MVGKKAYVHIRTNILAAFVIPPAKMQLSAKIIDGRAESTILAPTTGGGDSKIIVHDGEVEGKVQVIYKRGGRSGGRRPKTKCEGADEWSGYNEVKVSVSKQASFIK